jgi:hypothetical protein
MLYRPLGKRVGQGHVKTATVLYSNLNYETMPVTTSRGWMTRVRFSAREALLTGLTGKNQNSGRKTCVSFYTNLRLIVSVFRFTIRMRPIT